jgi:alpha/beta superfamily hydrolase
MLAGAMLVLIGARIAMADISDDPEEAVCGWLKERWAFFTWRLVAGEPDDAVVDAMANVERVSHQTRDGRMLRGFRIKAAGSPPRGYILVAQGNAMLADQVVPELARLAATGHDVYVYDYRGYGRSAGKSRLKAIVADYGEIARALDRAGYPRRVFYGISFGGIVLANVIGAGQPFERAVFDSAPARLSPYGCPERYDPVRNLPESSANIMFVAGARDVVVPLSMSRELSDAIAARGGLVLVRDDFAHPFMDRDEAVRGARVEAVQKFVME